MQTRRPIKLASASVAIVLVGGVVAVGAAAIVSTLPLRGDAALASFLASLGVLSVLLLATASAVAWLSARSISGDVQFVADRVRAMATRDQWRAPIAVRSLDEVGELTRAFETLRVGFIEKVERHRRAREQAEEADRYKTEFLTTVSHELRTPLNSILGFAQVLLEELDGPLTESQREDIRMIQSSGEHLLALFNDVLDLSAMASGRIELRHERTDLGPIFAETVRLLEAQRGARAVEIRTDIAPDVPPVSVDPKRLRQILMNLATNALKFTSQGEIALEARARRAEVVVTVRDTGCGIAAEELPTIFEEFTQAGAPRRRQGGAGLGLAIVKRLIELHGGRIWAESQVGVGSSFHVSLPTWRAEP